MTYPAFIYKYVWDYIKTKPLLCKIITWTNIVVIAVFGTFLLYSLFKFYM